MMTNSRVRTMSAHSNRSPTYFICEPLGHETASAARSCYVAVRVRSLGRMVVCLTDHCTSVLSIEKKNSSYNSRHRHNIGCTSCFYWQNVNYLHNFGSISQKNSIFFKEGKFV